MGVLRSHILDGWCPETSSLCHAGLPFNKGKVSEQRKPYNIYDLHHDRHLRHDSHHILPLENKLGGLMCNQ